jgi:hypothetical protein
VQPGLAAEPLRDHGGFALPAFTMRAHGLGPIAVSRPPNAFSMKVGRP